MVATPVVTCLIKHEGKILLLKRSGAVSTYQGRWAGVSGYLKNNERPEQRAIKEIEEETGLIGSDVILKKTGDVVEVVDTDQNRTWLIHTFLFEATSNKIKLNEENERYVWIRPEQLKNYNTVPALDRVFKKLLH